MPRTATTPITNNWTGGAFDGQFAEYGGTVVVNGASSVVVPQVGYQTGDIILFGLLTPGGTVGNLPHVVTGTTGTGFTIQGTASDTSTYLYLGLTPTTAPTA